MNKEFYEKEKNKGKILAIIIFLIIGLIILFFIFGIYFIKTNSIFKHNKTCYSLNIDNTNKEQIVALLENK